MNRKMLSALALSTAAVMLTACGASSSASIVTPQPADNATTAQPPATDTESPANDTQSPATDEPAETEQPTSTDTPQPIGTTLQVGDWQVTVTDVNKNAAAEIKKANMFNDKAEGVYILVTYSATYVGDDRKSDVEFDLSWSFTDSDSTVLDPAVVVTPMADQDKPTEARKGGKVVYQVAFDVSPKLVAGGIISAEELIGDTYGEWAV